MVAVMLHVSWLATTIKPEEEEKELFNTLDSLDFDTGIPSGNPREFSVNAQITVKGPVVRADKLHVNAHTKARFGKGQNFCSLCAQRR